MNDLASERDAPARGAPEQGDLFGVRAGAPTTSAIPPRPPVPGRPVAPPRPQVPGRPPAPPRPDARTVVGTSVPHAAAARIAVAPLADPSSVAPPPVARPAAPHSPAVPARSPVPGRPPTPSRPPAPGRGSASAAPVPVATPHAATTPDRDPSREATAPTAAAKPARRMGFMGHDDDVPSSSSEPAFDAMPVPAKPADDPRTQPRGDAMEEIKGKIKRLIHATEDGYRVYLVEIGKDDLVRIATNSPTPLAEGDKVVGKGKWRDYKGKPSFSASILTTDMPRDVQGIVQWLKSGAVPGIGASTAERLKDTLGGDLAAAISDPEALAKAGIPARKAAAIAEAWTTNSAYPELVTYLAGLGLGDKQIERVIKRYGMAARGTIETNPWQLAETVDFFGFKTADEIGLKAGHDRASPDRVKAGLRYALRQAMRGDGHCGLPMEELVTRAAALTKLARPIVTRFVDECVDGDKMLVDETSGLVTTRAMHDIERALCGHVMDLLEHGGAPRPAAEKAIRVAQAELGITLDDSQYDACVMALTNAVSIITGGPGTGKSTTQKVIVRASKALGRDVVLGAPTGRAAKRLADVSGAPASTCHRLLQYRGELSAFNFHRDNQFEEDAFVVDEYSMVDVKMAESFLQAVRLGAGVTIVGDVDQLPSVGPGQVLRDMIDSGAIPTARLTVVHRQGKDSGIVVASHAINAGRHPMPPGSAPMEGFEIEPIEHPGEAAAHVVELLTKILPARGFDPLNDVQVLSPQRKGDLGINYLNDLIKEALNPAVDGDERTVTVKNRKFTVGDRVMHTENDYARGVYNGEVGVVARTGSRVSSKGTKETVFVVDYDGFEVTYGPDNVDDVESAWATTIHKSQGCEFPVVVMAVNGSQEFMLNRNLIYTGITRAKKLCIVVGSDGVISKAVAKADRTRRYTGLSTMLRLERERRDDPPAPTMGRGGFLQIED